MEDLNSRLVARRAQGLYRERQILRSPQGVQVQIGDERLLAFCSNDYLGLASDPRVIEAFQAGARAHGVGAGASHLLSGHSIAHHALEEELAEFVGAPRALLFSTGYMANLGVVAALADRHATVFEDKLNHASLIDAARLSRATVRRYPHVDLQRLGALLSEVERAPRLIASDAVFSMDGDIAPVPQLRILAGEHRAWLVLDDAHGLGVLGPQGRGTIAHFGVPLVDPMILMGTLGKAFGVFGAFVAGSEALIETLIQRARTYIYTTALPPAVAEALRVSLQLVRAEDERRERLQALIARFRAGARELALRVVDSATPIQPVILGDVEAALAASRTLRERGLLVPAIRPPTVPEDTARLRITLSATHEFAHVDRLLEALAELPRC